MSGRFLTPPRLECGVTVEVTRQSTPVHGSCRLLPSGLRFRMSEERARPQCAIWQLRLSCFTFKQFDHE